MTVVQPTTPVQSTDPVVEAELDRLATMPIVQLRIRYREVFRADPPKAFGPDLLRRSIAHRIQEKAYGGLSHSARRLLDQMIKAYAARPNSKIVVPRRIKPGSVLVREWKGKSHRVTVLVDGFVYDGDTYSNLSAIAGLITGTKWNGPRFFGLRSKAEESSEPVDISHSGGTKRDSNADSIYLRPAGGGRSRGRCNIGGFGKSAANGNRHGS